VHKLVFFMFAAGLLAAATVALASASTNAAKVKPAVETTSYLMKGDFPCVNDWMFPGCNYQADAYSQLTQINKSNVSQLKVKWAAGFADPLARGQVQSIPLCCANNMMYLAAPNTIQAVEPDTGKIIWKYVGAKYDTTRAAGANSTTIQNASRGLGYNPIDNLIYSGQQGSTVVALNAKTGAPVWTAQVTGAGSGTYGSATSAGVVPITLYVNDGKDGLLLSAPSGGESPIRGNLAAFNAKTGKLVWRSWMIPDATQFPAILSWANPAEASTGGAPIWSPPGVDVENKTIFVGTGNTYPYLGRQPGKNLWTTSLVAVGFDGKQKWAYQSIHHDEWDYDCPHPPSVFKAMIGGKLTPVVAMGCKNAYAFYLNPKNGRCIFGCPEVKNSTLPGYTAAGEALNNAYPTQPRPVGAQGQLIEHCISDAYAREQIPYYSSGVGPDGKKLVLSCDMVASNADSWLIKPYYISNGIGVGSRAPYSPQTNMQYWPATASLMIEKNISPTDYHTDILNFGRVNYVGTTGSLTAINMANNTVAWQYKTRANKDGNIYSGMFATASGLLFYGSKGRTDAGGTGRSPDGTALRTQGINPGGYLTARDAKTGELLWEFQNPFADLIEGPPMTFMYKGKQYIAEYMMCPAVAQGPFKACDSYGQVVVLGL
jgi:quinohemoprotein ethanol dehydrogenase